MIKYLYLICILFFHIVLLSKMIFTAWPEVLSYPYLLSNGFSLYKDFAVPYTPGLVAIMAIVFNFFEFSVEVLKNFTWILVILTDISIFILLKQITKNFYTSQFFLFIYVTLQSLIDGNMLWFDYATVLPLVWAIFFTIKWINQKSNRNLILASLMFGLTIFTKQIALVYLVAFMVFFFLKKKIIFNDLLIIFLGLSAVFMPFLIYLLVEGSFSDFLNWTLIFPLFSWRNFPGYIDYEISQSELVVLFLLISILLWSVTGFKALLKNQVFRLTLLMFLATLIATFPRFSFFHLQPAIALSVISASALYVFIKSINKLSFFIHLLGMLLITVLVTKNHVFGNEIRFYGVEDIKLTSKLNNQLRNEKITYLLGFNSAQYVFTNTSPVKPWVESFGWYMESPGVQNQVIRGLENKQTQTVFVKKPKYGNWFDLETYQPKQIIKYIYNKYYLSGIIDESIEIWKRKKE